MKTRTLVVLLAVLALALPLAAQTGKTKVVESSDGSLKLSVPSDWTEQELNDAAEIQVGSEEQSSYLIVLIEKKADLFGWNLERHSFVTLGKLLADVDLPKISGPKAMKIGDIPAIQYEVRGAASGTNIVYLHTTIETPDLFAQILAWTVPSKEAANRKKLENAILSIRPVE
jgi:hypothetical protein